MNRFVRLVCILLCLMLLPAGSAWAQEDSAPTIRVLLRRLGLTAQADLILDGVYTASTTGEPFMAFPKGSKVTVFVRGGSMYLSYEGMNVHLGQQLTLTRNASPEQVSEGIRFAEGGNFYPGDLHLSLKDGVLQPVLTLCIEDYLLGVVPYEMGAAFPLEALKAQAVCARTYALAHIDPDEPYDVVDTTNDQVFKGVDLSETLSIQAVKETAGIVGGYRGRLATCFYSASNGGQTLLPGQVWSGRGDYPYYAVTADPYDLANPESVVRTAMIPKNGGLSSALTDLLADALSADMAAQGFGEGGDCLRVDSVSAAELHTPRYPHPDQLMTRLTLTFTWSGRSKIPATVQPQAIAEDTEISLFSTIAPTHTPAPLPSATPEPVPVYGEYIAASQPATVTIDLFPGAIRALGLSISGADNEMVTLTETEDAFLLEARRYGHGVGMSQRGAQWMALTDNKQYHEILSFYYPGMELMKISAAAPALPTPRAELAASAPPPATPTPRPTLMPVTETLPQGAYLASVEGIADDSSLNLRAEPHTAATILMRLYKHQPLVVLETCENPAWVKVRTDVIEGYVMVNFLEAAQ